MLRPPFFKANRKGKEEGKCSLTKAGPLSKPKPGTPDPTCTPSTEDRKGAGEKKAVEK